MPIDRTKTVAVKTPDSWIHEIEGDTVAVLPLLIGKDSTPIQRRRPDGPLGWCTYAYEHEQAPELEQICGGINSKTSKAGAIWRQGNLLHFGFEPGPDEMNETGRALLVNAIAYISRFTEDRAIIRTPSSFAPGYRRIIDRDAIGRLVKRNDRDLDILQYFLSPNLYATVRSKTREELGEWFQQVRPYLCDHPKGGLMLDEDARALGAGPASWEFFDHALAALREPGKRDEPARRLLCRYAPDGPGLSASADQWAAWLAENRSCLFFSDTGGFRWYVDPLAKARGVPTDKLRGPQRATRPAIDSRPNGRQ